MQGSKTSGSNIKVFCRFRPFNAFEQQYNHNPIHRIVSNRHLVVKDSSRHEQMPFLFDQVFDIDTMQQQIYQEVGEPVLLNILDGFNGTIMAYGQTSSGKTYTMQGPDMNSWQEKGIIPRIIEGLFYSIEKSPENLQFKLKVSIFEIYMQKIRDLLDISKNDLKVRENKHGAYIQYITEAYIGDKSEFYKILLLGQKNRATCATNMNSHSSRSHMIFLLTLSQYNSETSQAKTSKLYLVDLAGSQKVSKTGAEGLVLEEAKKINMSLASLGKVIKGLSAKIAHIPYRDSKLTRIIRDSLGGNSKTTLIVTCSPHELHLSQTISTLRFGESAQKIKNKPKINREHTVEQLQAIIQKLQATIQQKNRKIRFLQSYIKNDLGKQLPQTPKKATPKKGRQPDDNFLHSTTDLNSFRASNNASHLEQSQQFSFFEKSQKSSYLLGQSLDIQQYHNSLASSTNYDERFSSLQTQLASSKANLKSQLNKYYQLKKQYNLLNENMKEVISQNLFHQERQKQYEEGVQKVKDNIIDKCKQFYDAIGHDMTEKTKNCTCSSLQFSVIQQYFTQKWQKFTEQVEKIRIQLTELIPMPDYTIIPKHKKNKEQKRYEYRSQQKKHSLHPKLINETPESDKNTKISIEIPEMGVEQNLLDDSYTEPSAEKLKKVEKEFNQILQQKSNWKIEQELYKRKIKQKDFKIEGLQQILKEISQQAKMMMDDSQEVSVNSKIVKPIKGGCLYN